MTARVRPPKHRELVCGLFGALATLASTAPALAESREAPRTPTLPARELAGRLGYAYFMHGRSIALPHTVKPALALAAFWPLSQRFDLGASANAVLANPNYGVWAGYAAARFRVLDGDFRLAATLGLGLGHDAPILHPSLKAQGSLLPYATLGVQALFTLDDNWKLGVELSDEQLSVLHLGAALSTRY